MYIAIDVGGSKTRIAKSDDLTAIAAAEDFLTPKKFEQGIERITAVSQKLTAGEPPQAIIIGLPGILDKTAGKIKLAPNLPQWNNKEITAVIAQKIKTAVFLENDSALGGLGEAVLGAGRDKKIVAYLALGTGVGGGRIVNKKIDGAGLGFEPGHQLIVPDGDLWSCGQRGCLEAYVSGTAFAKRYGVNPKECGDLKIWQEYAQWLGRGMINLLVLWSPEIIVLGGSMARSAPLFLPSLQIFIEQNLKVGEAPPIVQGALDDKAGIYGGLSFLKQIANEGSNVRLGTAPVQ